MKTTAACPYRAAGFADRRAYLDDLRQEYGAEIVDAATACLPASEDFDGLVTALEDWAEQEENW